VRRVLPPLNPLRSFEAAARHESYTLAAEELNVTQVAVSRQVRVLEQYLQVSLVEHGARSFRLTAAGRNLLPELTEALDRIERAIAGINRRQRRNVISLQVYYAFAQRWLIPRMPKFRERHPNIEVDLRTSDQPLDFERQNLDAAIVSAVVPPAEFDCRLLAKRALFPVCAPALVAGKTLPLDAGALRHMTLLHSLARPDSWPEWLAGAGCKQSHHNLGMRFETSSMVLQAAVAGMGVAMGIGMLVEHELQSGQLVAPFSYVHTSERKYYFVAPKTEERNETLTVFMDWVIAEAAPYKSIRQL
jgi:LysR family glycine cleavage system transcriptional activator